MRDCRPFLSGIPHFGVGHPRVPHPSATRCSLLLRRVAQLVRLACVRHAASVYPEPGSNSPSKYLWHTPSSAKRGRRVLGATYAHARGSLSQEAACAYVCRSCDPGQSSLLVVKHLAVRRLLSILPPLVREAMDEN
jgi:hypothetical protein